MNPIGRIDYALVGIYLAVIFVVGMWKGWKELDIGGYATGGRRFPTLHLTLTLAATVIGPGVTLGLCEQTFKVGTAYGMAWVGYALSYFIMGWIFTQRLAYFSQHLSIASVMGSVYGRVARIFVGVVGFVYLSISLGAQLKALGYWLASFYPLTYTQSLWLCAGLTVLYSAFGGIKGVTITDVLQFFLIVLGLPIVAWFGVRSVGGWDNIRTVLPKEKLNPFAHPKLFSEYIPMFLIFAIPTFSPHVSQRLLMARTVRQAKWAFYNLALLWIPLLFTMTLIGLAARVRTPGIPAGQAFGSIALTLLPSGFKGLAVIGILAVIMSSADSVINTVGVLFAHDIVNPLLKNRLNSHQQMILARWACLLVGGLGIWSALGTEDLLGMKLMRRLIWAPTLVVPIMGTLLGYHASRKRFFGAVTLGILVAFLWDFYLKPITHVNAILPGILGNLLVFVDFPLVIRARWQRFQLWRWRRIEEGRSFWKVLGNVFSLNRWARKSQRMVYRDGMPVVALSVFFCVDYLILFMCRIHDFSYFQTMVGMYLAILGLLAILLMRDHWPEPLSSYGSFVWHITLILALPFLSVFGFWGTPSPIFFVNLILSLVILMLLVDLRTFVGFTAVGGVGGVFFHLYIRRIYPMPIDWSGFAENSGFFVGSGVAILLGVGIFSRRSSRLVQERLTGVRTGFEWVLRWMDPGVSSVLEKSVPHDDLWSVYLNFVRRGYLSFEEGAELTTTRKEMSVEEQNRLLVTLLRHANLCRMAMGENSEISHRLIRAHKVLQRLQKQFPFKEGEVERVEFILHDNFAFLGSESILLMVLSSLLENALKATVGNSRGRIKIESKGLGGRGWIVVEDNGMPSDILEGNDLFDPLLSSDFVRGMHLYFCRRQLNEMGCSIRGSVAPKGSLFVLGFPAVPFGTPVDISAKA
ncbi:MAG: hypothetical protein LBR62_03255 [Puniceicoccales bacterium]|jgi:Na+/proline symporter|nr:hypothetical protein [Puniceicoccales bacterium]